MVTPNIDQIQLAEMFNALGHPVRLAILLVLSDGESHRCGTIVTGVTKSTLTHHWRVLRDAGIIHQEPSGRENLLSLRRADLNARFPGLLDSILSSLTNDSITYDALAGHFATAKII